MTSDAGAGSSSTGGSGFGSDGQMGGAAGAPPVCPRHPDRVSYVRCQRCNRPTCPECQRPASVGIQCVDCVNAAKSNQRPLRSRLGFTAAQGPPVVTYVLIGLNVAMFLYGTYIMGAGWQAYLGLWPGYTAEFGAQYIDVGNEWYRWITSGFIHFGWLHLGMNMFVLWQFGTQLEPIMGRVRFGVLYLASLLGGSLAIELIASSGLHGGASGAIFGLIAAYAVVLKRLNLPFQSLVATAGIWLVLGFVVPNISWEGHLGGAVAGAVTMLLMFRGVDKREKARLYGG
ncbi:rhomboid family intramembrane serine protease [Demequina aurantiaca]|uniref:rhomboid family intramembrane serine protease n=1 Tax=Demequina aurantiaca TaxID=676200 RepID=UPI00078431AC|nr:rhomboid family intramembrane serine protease [Demequina aurantiaca]